MGKTCIRCGEPLLPSWIEHCKAKLGQIPAGQLVTRVKTDGPKICGSCFLRALDELCDGAGEEEKTDG